MANLIDIALLLDLPEADSLDGQHLLDIFHVDPEFSTTLTAIRSKLPVLHRYDRYQSTTGKDLTTVNASYPVLRADGSVLGSISIEQTLQMIRRQLTDLLRAQQILTDALPETAADTSGTRYVLEDLVGSSAQLQAAIHLSRQMAPRDINLLIYGETGTGKELFAQGIHALSSRKNQPFIAVNCAAFPETLIEGLLFGTVKGAFTGSTDKIGLIEEANHGTLFLDELNSMSLPMQAKLLRVLQEGSLRRVGGTRDIPIDVRVLSSCNEDPFSLTEQGSLRKDLFYRLASVIIEVPPLRERMEDLEELVWHYLHNAAQTTAQPIRELTPAFWACLRQHNWPGNVRELFHILRYAANTSQDGVLREENLPAYFLRHKTASPQPAAKTYVPTQEDLYRGGLAAMMNDYEQQLIQQAYLLCGQNATKTAALLKLSRQNFQYYMKKHGFGSPS